MSFTEGDADAPGYKLTRTPSHDTDPGDKLLDCGHTERIPGTAVTVGGQTYCGWWCANTVPF